MKKQNNRQRYRDIFDQIKLSDEGYRQIRNMEENAMIHFNQQNKKRMGFRVAVSLAACAIVFLSANGIAYAATGSTLIEQVTEYVSITINGKPYQGSKITKSKDKNGNTQYRVSVDENTDHSVGIEVDESNNENHTSKDSDHTTDNQDTATDKHSPNGIDNATDENAPAAQENIIGQTSPVAEKEIKTSVKQVDDTIYLILEGISKKPVQVDISKDYTDGKAKGSIKIEGIDYQYSVEGTVTEYSVDLERK